MKRLTTREVIHLRIGEYTKTKFDEQREKELLLEERGGLSLFSGDPKEIQRIESLNRQIKGIELEIIKIDAKIRAFQETLAVLSSEQLNAIGHVSIGTKA